MDLCGVFFAKLSLPTAPLLLRKKVLICSVWLAKISSSSSRREKTEKRNQKRRRKKNFIYIEINNHWKPSVWAHSNVIYDVIHHFYREKTFSCLSLRLSPASNERPPPPPPPPPPQLLLLAPESAAPSPDAAAASAAAATAPSVIGQGLFVSLSLMPHSPSSVVSPHQPTRTYMRLAGCLKKLEKVFAKKDVNFKARLCSTTLMIHATPPALHATWPPLTTHSTAPPQPQPG